MAIVDICMLDINSLKYSYSVVAAAALYHKFQEEILLCSSYPWEDIEQYFKFMLPVKFANKAVEECELEGKIWEDTRVTAHDF